MIHAYAVVSTPNVEDAAAKGNTDYSEPQNNRSVRYSLDETKVLIEGAFTDEEYDWFIANAVLVGTASDILTYIAANRAEWEMAGEI